MFSDKDGETALMIAAKENTPGIVRELIRGTRDVNLGGTRRIISHTSRILFDVRCKKKILNVNVCCMIFVRQFWKISTYDRGR